jgi:hypothetical protein
MHCKSIRVDLGEGVGLDGEGIPRLFVNGVDIAGMITRDWVLTEQTNEDGVREARLTVTYVTVLP